MRAESKTVVQLREVDPFDPEALRVEPGGQGGLAGKRVYTRFSVHRPSSESYFRVHPDPQWRLDTRLYIAKEDRTTYLISRDLWDQIPATTYDCTVFSVVDRHEIFTLWPIPICGPDGRDNSAWQTARDAARRAMRTWVRLMWNAHARAYDVFEAHNPAVMGEPQWPEMDRFADVLRLAFQEQYIDREDHPLLLALKGAV